METNRTNMIRQQLEAEPFDENGFQMSGTDLIRQQLDMEPLDETNIQLYIGRQISTMASIERKIESSQEKARRAQEKANVAQGKIRAFHKKEAIEKLQEATLAESEALGEITDCNTCIFENQKAMAEVTKRLLFLGVGNMARNRAVVKKISEYLAGMNSGDPNSMMKCELIGIVSELNSQLDLMRRVQNISQGLIDVDDAVSLVQSDVVEIKENDEKKEKAIGDTKKDVAGLKKELEDKDKALTETKNDVAGLKKVLEDKDKALTETKNDVAGLKKVLEDKDKALTETRKIAEKAMEQNENASKKRNVGIWVLCGIIVIATISLALIFGKF